MMSVSAVEEVIALYSRHGWELRRLLSQSRDVKLIADKYRDVIVADFAIDAAWFARPRRLGPVAWEIRYLGKPPFALLESLDEADPAFEDNLRAVEQRLLHTVRAKA